MKPFRVLMMLTTLAATASAVHAQSPGSFVPPGPYALPKEPGSLEAAAQQANWECAGMTAPAWYTQALQQGAATWQRLRAICSTGKQDSACCEGAGVKAAGCALGVAGSAKTCAAVQAPRACACVKACACCESCKEMKETTSRGQAQPMPPTAEMMQRTAGWRGIAQLPASPPPVVGVPPAQGTGVVQVVPVPGVRVVQVVQTSYHLKPVHLVTPDLDAHCERVHYRGDAMVLEGNVLLLCRKHAHPIRIEAQRVIVNMRDGSFTVESDVRPVSTSSFGVQRTSAVAPPTLTVPVKVQETRTGSLMFGAGVNSDNGVSGSNVGYSVTRPRDVPSNSARPASRPDFGPERARETQCPASPADLEALFNFWCGMYR